MIVCSCNVFSDHQLRSTLANATQRLRMSQIYDYLGSGAQCGRCAHIIKRIMDEMTNGAIVARLAPDRRRPLPVRPPRYGVSVISPGGPVIDPRPSSDLKIAASADRFVCAIGAPLRERRLK